MHIVNGLLFLLVMLGCPMAFCDLFLTCKPKFSCTCSLDYECVVEDSDSLVNTVANAYALGKKGKTHITKHFFGSGFSGQSHLGLARYTDGSFEPFTRKN